MTASLYFFASTFVRSNAVAVDGSGPMQTGEDAMWRDWLCSGRGDSPKADRRARSLFLCHDGAQLVPSSEPASFAGCEPKLDELLSDPIVTALMQADGVDPQELAAMLTRIAQRLSAVREGAQQLQAD
jgi:hypothetical protein